jgi:hypothetical protein
MRYITMAELEAELTRRPSAKNRFKGKITLKAILATMEVVRDWYPTGGPGGSSSFPRSFWM